jgi:hypothetical protein
MHGAIWDGFALCKSLAWALLLLGVITLPQPIARHPRNGGRLAKQLRSGVSLLSKRPGVSGTTFRRTILLTSTPHRANPGTAALDRYRSGNLANVGLNEFPP